MMRLFLVVNSLLITLSLPIYSAHAKPEFSSKAPQSIAIDYTTGAILFDQNSKEQMAPSSMTKLMTLYILFDKLKKGELSLEDKLEVSEKAWKKGGSKMFVKVGSNVLVEDLLRGIVVQSGNDACIVVAEGISGSEGAFADEMNYYGQKIGLTGSNFRNSTGWPDDEHYMTSRDLAVLTVRLINDFPEYYHYFNEQEYTYNGIKQYNRNTLLRRNNEIDGLKTGHTEAGGYGIVISGRRGVNKQRRVVVVVNGLGSEKERINEANRVYEHVMRDYNQVLFFAAGEEVGKAKVWFGDQEEVSLVSNKDIIETLSRFDKDKLEVRLEYDEPIPAPIKKGDEIAKLYIKKTDEVDEVVPLYAGEDVEELSGFGRISAVIDHYL